MLRNIQIRHYASGLAQEPHRHDVTTVTLLLKGQLRERIAGTEISADPLSLVIKPAGVVHANQFGPASVVTCQIELNADAHEHSRWSELVNRWRWIIGGRSVSTAIQLARMIENNADVQDVHEMAESVLDALDVQAALPAPPSWLVRALEMIEDELASGTQPLRVARIAAAADVHPVHLARVFHRQMGMPIPVWIRRRRMQRAAACMAISHESLSVLAAASGFADQSHMNRTFRREAGVLPGRYREIIHAL